MSLTINTNSSAATATMHLSKNNAALKKSLNRLSSGTRIVQPVDDAGGLAVSMKLEEFNSSFGRSSKEHTERPVVFGSTGRHP